MKSLHLGAVVGSVGLCFLGVFNNNQAIGPDSSSIAIAAEIAIEKASQAKDNQSRKGGQVVESGAYHLELVPEKEANGTHLDFYLHRGDTHQPIPNAKVTAQVQMPDGTQKNLNFKYDASGKHYAAMLPGTAGQYQMRVTADVEGKKVSGRFSFKQ